MTTDHSTLSVVDSGTKKTSEKFHTRSVLNFTPKINVLCGLLCGKNTFNEIFRIFVCTNASSRIVRWLVSTP